MATKKIGVEIAATFAEIIPHTNIAARASASAAMSITSFHPFSSAAADHLNIDPMQLRPRLKTWGLVGTDCGAQPLELVVSDIDAVRRVGRLRRRREPTPVAF
jgi:hypothetical protein